MPELPEVEIVRRGLEPALVNKRISRVVLRWTSSRFATPSGALKKPEIAIGRLLAKRPPIYG